MLAYSHLKVYTVNLTLQIIQIKAEKCWKKSEPTGHNCAMLLCPYYSCTLVVFSLFIIQGRLPKTRDPPWDTLVLNV